ncbi:hypothetical protein HPB52_010054 [Rhipicephalus sanguineus]|uniref:RING-type domain-containing protein n=1 Tax=Rhipicephalus sanguineus TaxID=34632 RepID=A0A9D4T5D1_RHISA|nr:hypothetical protein HPB52_010054 [Rhipicephalus sanguineus]
MGEIKHGEPERQLSGFGGTLEWRPLVFVESVPYVYSCTLCGVIAAFPKRITRCCHVFCPLCFERFVDGQRLCPLDQIPFADGMIETLDSGHGGVNQLQARCPNATHGCTFVAHLAQLEDHFLHHCKQKNVQCPRCGLDIIQRTALSHFFQDCSGVRKVVSANEDGRAYWDVSCSSVLNRKSLSADSVVSSSATKDYKDEARKSSSADTARDKTFATAGIRKPSQQKREASDRSSSSSNSALPSAQSSIIKTSHGTAASTKQDRHDETRNANPSKIAKGVRKTHSSLSEKKLLEKVESMITRAAENASDAASSAETSVSPETTSSGVMSTSITQVHHNKTLSTEFVSSPSAKNMKHLRKVKVRDTMDKQDADEKAVAAVSPTGFVFCYITGLVGSDTRLACGEELFLRSDSSKFAGCGTSCGHTGTNCYCRRCHHSGSSYYDGGVDPTAQQRYPLRKKYSDAAKGNSDN